MRILLDSHAFLWFVEGDSRLSIVARELIENPANEKWLSLASAWEVAVKTSIGKLTLSQSLHETFFGISSATGIELLPINLDHVLDVAALPFHHRDPFDRLIAAQSLRETMPLISGDPVFDSYGVQRM